MYQEKKRIVEQELRKRFRSWKIYSFAVWVFKDNSTITKTLWFLFVGLAIIGMVADIEADWYRYTIFTWFALWIALLWAAGIDRIRMDLTIGKVFRISEERIYDELSDTLSDGEFRFMLKDILGE